MTVRRPALLTALLVLCALAPPPSAQGADSARVDVPGVPELAGADPAGRRLSGSLSVTNNGISPVPLFTLGRPAAVLNLAAELTDGGRLRFEPELRMALDGEPWSFLFWLRYDLVDDGPLRVRVGAHPALSFVAREVELTPGAASDEAIIARRFLAGETAVSVRLTDVLGVGAYGLYAYGVEPFVTRHGLFTGVNATASSGDRLGPYTVRVTPQVYVLTLDGTSGLYATSALTVSREGLPVSLSSVVNATVDTDNATVEPFLWNVTATLRF